MKFHGFLEYKARRIIVIFIGIIFVFSWWVINFQIQDYQKRLKIAKLHLRSMEEVKTMKQMVDSRESLINNIQMGKVPSAGLLKLISAVIPPSIILNEFNLDESGRIMQLKGMVMTSKELAVKALTDFRRGLENSKFVREVSLINSQGDQGLNSFELEAKLAQ